MIHQRVNKQFNLFGLILASCDYGCDIYWKERKNYLLTVSKTRLILNWRAQVIIDITAGIIIGKKQRLLPNAWRKLFGNGNP